MSDIFAEQFQQKYESLAGHVHRMDRLETAIDLVEDILIEQQASQVAVYDLPSAFQNELLIRCKKNNMECIAPPFDSTQLPDAIDAAQVGISTIQWAIAQTGTLVEVAIDDAQRLVSSLPQVHIALVKEENLLATLDDVAPHLRKVFEENPKNCSVSFISGPSRTADIEMKLTLGVHGPKTSYVILFSNRE